MLGHVVDGRRLVPGGQRFRGDDGSADPAVAAALAAYGTGEGTEHAVLTALATSRLLVPVVAVPGEPDENGAEKTSEMALPKLIGQDGRAAILGFTSTATLSRWRADGRPVPAEAGRVWQAAIAEGCAVVIDVAGPVPLAVEGARLAALAAGQPVPQPYQDPDIHAELGAAIAGTPGIAGLAVAPGEAGSGTDVTVRLLPEAGRIPDRVFRLAAAQISRRLAGRVRGVRVEAGTRHDTARAATRQDGMRIEAGNPGGQ